jgi:predicted AlkP superfamily pyrophosphatase or phosphodiesterase
MRRRTILIFIDGLGWGEPNPEVNPQHAYGRDLFRLPALDHVLQEMPAGGWARPLDAVLGVEGVPQSATGQTTLLTGINAQQVLGKHLTGFPNETLRKILLENSILKTLTDLGLQARFLNAFRPRFWELSRERQLTLSATTVANLAADLPFFTLDDVREGRSIYEEFTNAELKERGFDLAPLAPAEAGRVLARASRGLDFTLFEYFQSDKAGHSGDSDRICRELVKLDDFLGTLLEELAEELVTETLVLVTSDHGNLEDATTRRHTLNPVPLVGWGEGAREFLAPVTRLDQVTPAIVARHRAASG